MRRLVRSTVEPPTPTLVAIAAARALASAEKFLRRSGGCLVLRHDNRAKRGHLRDPASGTGR
jgi:hypothetical protein